MATAEDPVGTTTTASADGALARRLLPAGFERWRLVLRPGEHRATTAADWADTLVLIEQGVLAVECLAGGRQTFAAGDMLCLGWLPLRELANPGRRSARLIAIRRRSGKRA